MTRSRRAQAAALLVPGLAIVVVASGCSSTQDKSAALAAKASAVDAPGRVKLGRPDADVRLVSRREIRGKDGTAVVVELRNEGTRALVRVPVALRLLAGGKQTYFNDGEGGDELLLRVPVLPPRTSVTWVNSNVPVAPEGAKLNVVVGAPVRRSRRPAAPLRITGLRRSAEDTGSDGVAVTGTVRNTLRRTQTEVPIYVTVRDGDRVVAAGATRVESLAPRATATFEAVMVGDGRTGRLAAQALPTKLQTPRSSR